MNCSVEERGGVSILTPDIESLDATVTADFNEKVIDCITRRRGQVWILSLERIQHIDVDGIGALVALLRFVSSEHESLKLASLAHPVRTVLHIVRLDRHLEIYPTVQEAVRANRGVNDEWAR